MNRKVARAVVGIGACASVALAACSGESAETAPEATADLPSQACLAAALSGSADRLGSLAGGGAVEMPRVDFEYLVAAVRDVDSHGGASAFGSVEGERGARLAEAVALIANPRVLAIDSPPKDHRAAHEACRDDAVGKADADDADRAESAAMPDAGGIDALPPGIHSTLTAAPVEQGRGAFWMAESPELQTEDELTALADFLSLGADPYNQGSDANRLLLARAADISDAAVANGWNTFRSAGEMFDFPRHRVGDLLASLLAASGRDALAARDLLSIGGDPEPTSPAPGTDVSTLFAFDWDEGSGQDDGITTMLRRIGAIAVVGEDAPRGGGTGQDGRRIVSRGESVVSGESATALARILSDHAETFRESPHYSRMSLGELNPGVAAAAAAAVGPHLVELAGGDGEPLDLYGGSEVSRDVLQRAVSVLATDDDAVRTLVTQAMDSISLLQQEFGRTFTGRTDRDDDLQQFRIDLVVPIVRICTQLGWGIAEGLALPDRYGNTPRLDHVLTDGVGYDSRAGRGVELAEHRRESANESRVPLVPIGGNGRNPALRTLDARHSANSGYEYLAGPKFRSGTSVRTIELEPANPGGGWTLANLLAGYPDKHMLARDPRRAEVVERQKFPDDVADVAMLSDTLGEVEDEYTLYFESIVSTEREGYR